MNTTDLLLQMTLAATQIAQNTTPPVSGRTEDAGDRRDFSTLLAEKRVEAAGTETGRAVPESQKGEVPAAADGGALSQGAQSVPQAPGLEELFRSLLMGAQAAPEGDASLQQVPQTAVPGMAQAPAAAEEGAVLLQPGQQTAGGEQLPVPAEPALAGEAESTVQTEVLPAAEDGGTATAQAVTPAARESGAQTPADAGETAGRPARGEQELPELDSVQTEGAAQPLFDRTEHMPVKVGEADTLDATEPDFAPRLAKAITEAEQEGARHVELKLAPEHLGKLSVELTQGKDGHEAASGALRDAGIHAARQPQRRDPGGGSPAPAGRAALAAAGAAARTAARPQPTGTGTAAPEYRGLPAAASAGLAGRRSGVTEKGVARNEQ